MSDQLQFLYDTATERNIELGTQEEFYSAMQDEDNRQWLYDELQNRNVNLGEYGDYESSYKDVADNLETEFNPLGDNYDYDYARSKGISKDEDGVWADRDDDTGRILKGLGDSDILNTFDREKARGNVMYMGDDGNIYSHNKDSVSVEPENLISREIIEDGSSLDKIGKDQEDTSKKYLDSVDYNIPQINDAVWDSLFTERYNKPLSDASPEESVRFAIEEIIQNKSGVSPITIQNFEAYNNGSWAQYKDWKNEQYVAVAGADPNILNLIDEIGGGDSSTIKAVFMAESGFQPDARGENWKSEESKVVATPEAPLIVTEEGLGPSLRAAPPQSLLSRLGDRVSNILSYRDLSMAYRDPTPEQVIGRNQGDFIKEQYKDGDALHGQLLKDIVEKQKEYQHKVFHTPGSPEYENEVKEMVAWEVMNPDAPTLFSGGEYSHIPTESKAIANALTRAGVNEQRERALKRSTNPREEYKRKLRSLGIDLGGAREDFVRSAWSQSLTGVSLWAASGKDVDLNFYDPGDGEQIAAGIVSMLMPVDALAFSLGGAYVGGAISKVLPKAVTPLLQNTTGKLAVKRLVNLGYAPRSANIAVNMAINRTVGGMASFAGALGTYGGLGTGLRGYKENGFVDPFAVTKDIISHAGMGLFTGLLAELGPAVMQIAKPGTKGLKYGSKPLALTSDATKFMGEVTGFAAWEPLVLGTDRGRRLPTAKEWTEAATFLLGMKMAHPMMQIYGKGTYLMVRDNVAKMMEVSYRKSGDFKEAQVEVKKGLETAVEIAMRGEIPWLESGNGWSGGRGIILGENPQIVTKSGGIGYVLDKNGKPIPYQPALTQKELTLTGEIREPKYDTNGNPVLDSQGVQVYETVAVGRSLPPVKSPGESRVPGSVVDVVQDVVPLYDKKGKPVLDKKGEQVYQEVDREVREQIPISEAVSRQLELPAWAKPESIKSLPTDVLDVMLKAETTTPREKQIIRVEQERRKLTAPPEKDVSGLIQQRGEMQVEQNRLFSELKTLEEGTPEYIRKEKEIVENGDRMQELDNQIADTVVPVKKGELETALPIDKKAVGERGLGLKPQEKLPGQAEVPLGPEGEGGVLVKPVGRSKVSEPKEPKSPKEEAPPEKPAEEVVVEYGEEPVPKDTKGLINALNKPEKHDRGEVIDALDEKIDEYGADTKGLLESINYPSKPNSVYYDAEGNSHKLKDITTETKKVRGREETRNILIDALWFEQYKPTKGPVGKPEAPPLASEGYDIPPQKKGSIDKYKVDKVYMGNLTPEQKKKGGWYVKDPSGKNYGPYTTEALAKEALKNAGKSEAEPVAGETGVEKGFKPEKVKFIEKEDGELELPYFGTGASPSDIKRKGQPYNIQMEKRLRLLGFDKEADIVRDTEHKYSVNVYDLEAGDPLIQAKKNVNEGIKEIDEIELSPHKKGWVSMNSIEIAKTPNDMYTFGLSANVGNSGFGSGASIHNTKWYRTKGEAIIGGMKELKRYITSLGTRSGQPKWVGPTRRRWIKEIDKIIAEQQAKRPAEKAEGPKEKGPEWQDYKSKGGKRTIAQILEVGEGDMGTVYVRKNPDGTYRIARFVEKAKGQVLYSIGDRSYSDFKSALKAAKAEVGEVKPEADAVTPEKSKGHIAFKGNYEYAINDKGELMRGDINKPVMPDGYRGGMRFETPKHLVKDRLKALGIPYSGASKKVKEDFRRMEETVEKMDMPQVTDGGKIYRFTGEYARPDGKKTGKWEMFVASMKDSPTQGWQPVKNYQIRKNLDKLLKEKEVAEVPSLKVGDKVIYKGIKDAVYEIVEEAIPDANTPVRDKPYRIQKGSDVELKGLPIAINVSGKDIRRMEEVPEVDTAPRVPKEKRAKQYDAKHKARSTWYRNLYELTHTERTYTEMGEDALIGKSDLELLDKAHRKAIKDAVLKGLPVRKEVLNDPVVGTSAVMTTEKKTGVNSIPDNRQGLANAEKDLTSELKKGNKADYRTVEELTEKIIALKSEKINSTVDKPNEGDQITVRTVTKKTTKKQVVKKPIDDPIRRDKQEFIAMADKLESEILGQFMDVGQMKYSSDKALEPRYEEMDFGPHKMSVEIRGEKKDPFLIITRPDVNGHYETILPKKLYLTNKGISKNPTGTKHEPLNFTKSAVTKSYMVRSGIMKLGGARATGEPPRFTAPTMDQLSTNDSKRLDNIIKGYQKSITRLNKLKKTDETEQSIGQYKEALKIAKELKSNMDELKGLSDVMGMDFIPGATALFNTMRRWKRSKLPVTDRDRYDYLTKRSNKLYNEWIEGGKTDKVVEGRLEELSSKLNELEAKVSDAEVPTPKEIIDINKTLQWPSRRSDLGRVHRKQDDVTQKLKDSGEKGVDEDYRGIKMMVTNNRTNTLADFTKEELAHYEEIVDRMSEKGGYLDAIPDMIHESASNKLWTHNLVNNSILSYAVDKITRIKSMGSPGKKLAQHLTDFVIRQTQIKGDGESTIYRIKKLIGRKNMKYFTAAIDPYLSEGMDIPNKEAFLNKPEVKEAAKLWKEYTDRLHEMRVKYDTYVLLDIEGKKVKMPAEDVYLDNWIRYQLKEDVYKELNNIDGPLMEREAQKLVQKKRVANITEAKQLIGEWLRHSPYNQGPTRYSSSDRPRLLLLSPELYETSFAKLVPGITRRYATFLAAAENFGQDMYKRDRLIGEIATGIGRNTADEATNLVRDIIEGNRLGQPGAIFSGLTRGIGTLHLTWPVTFFNNIMYSHTTDMPSFGVRAATKAWFNFFKNPKMALMGARERGQLGVGVREIESITLQEGLTKWTGYIPGGITPSEFLNRARAVYAAGYSANIYSKILSNKKPQYKEPEWWLSAFQGNVQPKKLARRFFKEFGGFSNKDIDKIADRGYLTDAEYARIESFAPSVTQGSTHQFFMPELMSGKLSPVGSLHKMAYRATVGVYKSVVKPMYDGNFGPLLKWGATTAAFGELSYYLNHLLYGWEHPQGGGLDGFIEYLQGEDADKDKAKALVMRLGSNILRAQGFGLLSDTMQGYGMMPIIFDATENAYSNLYELAYGKKTFGQVRTDLANRQVALWRGAYRVERARFQPRSDEYVLYNNVKRYTREFRKDEGKTSTIEKALTINSSEYREIQEAFWYADAKEIRKVLGAAQNSMVDKAMELPLKEGLNKAKLESYYKKEIVKKMHGTIKRMHPLYGIPGYVLSDEGKLLKRGDKSPDGQRFWSSLKPYQKKNIVQSVENYFNILKEMKIYRNLYPKGYRK